MTNDDTTSTDTWPESNRRSRKQPADDPRTNRPSAGSRSRSVKIPAALGERIDRRIEATTFETDEAYVRFVLEQILGKLDRVDGGIDGAAAGDGTARAEGSHDETANDRPDDLATRLESLGYL